MRIVVVGASGTIGSAVVRALQPPWIAETLAAMEMDPKAGMPARDAARAYVAAVEGAMTGQVLDTRRF